jgi:hypothetical protein
MSRAYPAVYLKTKGRQRLGRQRPFGKENPDAHNFPPLERASGYGNTAGTTCQAGLICKGSPRAALFHFTSVYAGFLTKYGGTDEYTSHRLRSGHRRS